MTTLGLNVNQRARRKFVAIQHFGGHHHRHLSPYEGANCWPLSGVLEAPLFSACYYLLSDSIGTYYEVAARISAASRNAARASVRVESRIGSTESSASISNGISVQPNTTASHPLRWKT